MVADGHPMRVTPGTSAPALDHRKAAGDQLLKCLRVHQSLKLSMQPELMALERLLQSGKKLATKEPAQHSGFAGSLETPFRQESRFLTNSKKKHGELLFYHQNSVRRKRKVRSSKMAPTDRFCE
jgi:hypothetical protein